MARRLDFTTLIPERDTFVDADGEIYEFLNSTDFGAVELARLSKAQEQVVAHMAALKADPGNEESAVAFESAVNDVLAIVLPRLPRARLADWTLGQKNAILDFWNQQKNKRMAGKQAAAEGEAKAGQPAQP